ncbi:MAG: hypothetical protein ACFCU4_08090 [Puniceicoccaceae bacterium]
MGLTIHYQGAVDRTELLPKLINELKDIALAMNWETEMINEDQPDPHFKGIIINPSDGCEPLSFVFDQSGRLRCLADLIIEQVEFTETSGFCFTKTQFASVDTHIWITGLLRYLKKHYMSNLRVNDEGEYWETEDRKALIEKKEFLQNTIDHLAERLQSTDFHGSPHSLNDIIAHIEKIVRRTDRGGSEAEEQS